jgi:hypothetical protein
MDRSGLGYGQFGLSGDLDCSSKCISQTQQYFCTVRILTISSSLAIATHHFLYIYNKEKFAALITHII